VVDCAKAPAAGATIAARVKARTRLRTTFRIIELSPWGADQRRSGDQRLKPLHPTTFVYSLRKRKFLTSRLLDGLSCSGGYSFEFFLTCLLLLRIHCG
jgi:hypothetical protein